MKLLIADPEPRYRSALASLCEHSGGLQVVGEVDSGTAAINAAQKLRPDLMLLDMEFQDMTGFDVLRAARRTAATLAIMLTTPSVNADRCEEAGVIDYLEKPIGAGRFAESIARARERCRVGAAFARNSAAAVPPALPVTEDRSDEGSPGVLVGEREHRLYVLKPEKIDYVESHGNYVKFHIGDAEFISRNSVKHLQSALTRCGFVRIERSLLVNVRAILYAQRGSHGTYTFTLVSGRCLQSGATYRGEILRVLPLAQAPVQ